MEGKQLWYNKIYAEHHFSGNSPLMVEEMYLVLPTGAIKILEELRKM